jgi:hypothetical protein
LGFGRASGHSWAQWGSREGLEGSVALYLKGWECKSVLGMWGRFGSSWLGKGDGGVVGGVQEGALV